MRVHLKRTDSTLCLSHDQTLPPPADLVCGPLLRCWAAGGTGRGGGFLGMQSVDRGPHQGRSVLRPVCEGDRGSGT